MERLDIFHWTRAALQEVETSVLNVRCTAILLCAARVSNEPHLTREESLVLRKPAAIQGNANGRQIKWKIILCGGQRSV